MKIYKILIICIMIGCVITSVITINNTRYRIRSLDAMKHGQEWESKDNIYAINIPNNWSIINIESIIAQDALTGTLLSTEIMNEYSDKNDLLECKHLMNMLRDNFISISESPNTTILESHSVLIDNYPSAYIITSFDEGTQVSFNSMVFAVSTPKGIFTIEFAMIPGIYFNKLRPVIEGIAGSFKLIDAS